MDEKLEKEPIITLAALDIGFGVLMQSIREQSPELAEAVKMRLELTIREIPQRLPQPQGSNIVTILEKWSDALSVDPSFPGHQA